MAFFVDVTVRGYELDTQGHLNRAVYPQYAEHARWSLLRAAGLPQEKLLAGGVGPVALEVTVKFLRELRDDERARVTCQFVYGSEKTFEVVRKVIKEDGTVAAEVTGVAGMLDLAARRLSPIRPDISPLSPETRICSASDRRRCGRAGGGAHGGPASRVASAQRPLSCRGKDLFRRSCARGAMHGKVRWVSYHGASGRSDDRSRRDRDQRHCRAWHRRPGRRCPRAGPPGT
ncbi:acyl-CoA thioesterase [Streptomyces sp. NBC_01617]|nr:acyl-CoA thioesterase [Streptomyces sp. NBC_01617]